MMPAHPDLPQQLREHLDSMERIVQDAKRSMAYSAPEMQDTHWIMMQNRLASLIIDIAGVE